MNTEPKTAGEILPKVISGLSPGPSKGDTSPTPTMEVSTIPPNKEPSIVHPLNTAWQRLHLRMENIHPQIQKAADEIEGWFIRLRLGRKDRRHLIITGPTGAGKTRLATNLKRVVAASVHGFYPSSAWTHPPIIAESEFSKLAAMEDLAWRDWWKDHVSDIGGCGLRAEILFLEDVGAEVDRFKTGEPAARLTHIFNEFKNDWLVVTTNVPVPDFANRWDSRVADRMFRNSVRIYMDKVPPFTKSKKTIPGYENPRLNLTGWRHE